MLNNIISPVNNIDKLQFLELIFAVLLSKLCNVSFCQSILKQFIDSQICGDLPYNIVGN